MIDRRWQEARRILAVRLDNLGDVLLATPAIHAIKSAVPDAEVTLLTSPVGAQVGRLNPDVDRVITYEAPWVDPWQLLPHDPAREQAMISSLRAGRYDAAVIFTSYHQSPLPAAYACYLAGIPLRLAASVDGPGSLLTTRHKHPARMMHEVERGLDLVSAIGVAPAELDLVLNVVGSARAEAADWSTGDGGPLVVVHPGCSMPARTYSWEQYAEAVERLTERLHARVVLTGTEAEADLVARIFQRLSPRSRLQTQCAAGRLAFPAFCALIGAADVVVTNNTGPMHIAAAMKTPVVALFALTNPPEQWHPWRVPHRLLYHDVPCRLCYSRVCPFEHDCLRLVTADEIVAAVADLLVSPPPAHRRVADGAAERFTFKPSRDGVVLEAGQQVRKIAVLRSLYLGDLLCATPALRALRNGFPDAEITLIGLPWAREMVERWPFVDRFVGFPGFPGLPEIAYDPMTTYDFIEKARRERYDVVVQMHGSGPASNDFVSALGGGMTVGFSRGQDEGRARGVEQARGLGERGAEAAALTKRTGLKPADECGATVWRGAKTIQLPWRDDEHEVLRWLRLVGVLGCSTREPRLEFPLLPRDFARADALLADGRVATGRLVGLHVGAKDPARRWPAARFAALADRLAVAVDGRFVLTGTMAERALVSEVIAAMHGPAVNLAGRTDLGALAAVIARFDLLITNDTGASHLAAAVGTPSVVLFGSTSSDRWGPLEGGLHRAVDARELTGRWDDGAAALAALPVEPVVTVCCEQLRMGKEAGLSTTAALEVICGN